MGKTSIEWTDASWNPIVGCSETSPGCANCYAARLAATRLKNTPQYKGLATIDNRSLAFSETGHAIGRKTTSRWTGEVRSVFAIDHKVLDEPLHWRKPRRIFVCDMGDLFHEGVHPGWLVEIFEVMRACPHHTFQVLTKRAARMHQWINERLALQREDDRTDRTKGFQWPLPNVWLGVSVENQHFAEERIPLLLDTPAAVRFISAEPLLGPVDLVRHFASPNQLTDGEPTIDWVICGGESGPGARPMHPDWARSLRDQCQSAGVPFFFKQWGEWFPNGQDRASDLPMGRPGQYPVRSDQPGVLHVKLGKGKAGRLLDGREWSEFPR